MGTITNKFLSVEILGTLILTAFTIGTVWASLNGKVENTDEKVRDLNAHQLSLAVDMNTIRTDIVEIRNEQKHIIKAIDDIKEQNKELSNIRQLLEKMQ